MKNKKYSLKNIFESVDQGIVGEVQQFLNANPWFQKIGVPTVKPEDINIITDCVKELPLRYDRSSNTL